MSSRPAALPVLSAEAIRSAAETQKSAFSAAMQANVEKARLENAQKEAALYAEISHEEFSTQMQAIQTHYLSFADKPDTEIKLFPLPIHLVSPHILTGAEVQAIKLKPVAPAPAADPIKLNVPAPAPTIHPAIVLRPMFTVDGNRAVGDAVIASHNELFEVIHSHAAAIMAAAEAMAKEKEQAAATAEFARKMNALRENAKAQVNAKINALYANFTNLGKVHPEQRPRILNATNSIGKIYGGLFGGVAAVHHTVITIVTAPVAAAGGLVKVGASAVQTVGKWASDAAQSAGNAFKKVLSIF